MRAKVSRSAVIDKPLDTVWTVLRGFGRLDQLHPAVSESRIENEQDDDAVGCVRQYQLAGVGQVREQLLSHSDWDHSCAYTILDAPLPLFDSVITLGLKPVTDANQTLILWAAHFRTSADRIDEIKELLGAQMFEAGIAGLRRFLADQVEACEPYAGPVHVAANEPEAASTAPERESLTARTIVVEAFGGPEELRIQEVSVPPSGPGQARIRHKVIGVNTADALGRGGFADKIEFPWTPGVEGVGEIIDVGDKVHGLFPGDRVAWVSQTPGAYAETQVVDADQCLPLPKNVTDIQASVLYKGLMAAILLEQVFRVSPGTTILIESCARGPGHILCQWAKSLDLQVVGLVSSEEQARFVRDLGCDHPLVVEGVCVRDEVMRITNGHGAEFLVHDGTSMTLVEALASLARFGHCAFVDKGVTIGPATGSLLDANLLRRRSLTLSGPAWFDYLDDPRRLHRSAHRYFTKLQNGSVRPVVEEYPLTCAQAAHEALESSDSIGALALVPKN